MSTEHPSTPPGTSDADLEYGPTPPDAKHEHTDIDPEVGYRFALWLTVAMVLSFGIVYGTFVLFERQAAAANAAARQFPLARDFERPRPTPALQTEPFRDIATLRQGEADTLNSYGWVDKEAGVARIPIDRAMEIMLQRGLPVRPERPADGSPAALDSASGRAVASR